jgi:signal transduction histidine kinase
MRERATHIASDLNIESSTAGTRVELIVPGGIIYSNAGSAPQNLLAIARSVLKKLGLV